MEYSVVIIIGAIICAIVWAVVCLNVANNKGYSYQGTKWFWLGFFFGIIALIILLSKPNLYQQNIMGGMAQNISVADELTKYKDLLDKGAITQEEFDRKKKELL